MEVLSSLKSNVIGVSGVAGSGKDTFYKLLQDYCKARDIKCARFSIADNLKKDLKPFCISNYKIDPLNCTRNEKDTLRPLMVYHGAAMRKISKGRHWINKSNKEINNKKYKDHLKVITDIRYNQYDKDEVDWLKKELGGVLVHISQFGEFKNPKTGKSEKDYLFPANLYEEVYDPQISELADYNISWKTVSDVIALSPHIRKFMGWMKE